MTLILTQLELPHSWIIKGCLCYPTPTPYLIIWKNCCFLVAYGQTYSNNFNATCLMNTLKYTGRHSWNQQFCSVNRGKAKYLHGNLPFNKIDQEYWESMHAQPLFNRHYITAMYPHIIFKWKWFTFILSLRCPEIFRHCINKQATTQSAQAPRYHATHAK